MERPRVTYAVEDRIRGIAGLMTLVAGFSFQVFGYVGVLGRSKVHYGHNEALIGAGWALAVALMGDVH